MSTEYSELLKLPPKPEKTVRFFRKGGSYFAIDSDAEMIATKHIHSFGALKDSNDKKYKYVSISDNLYSSLLRDLLLYNHTSIEVWEFESNHYTKTTEASPGNVMPVIDIINADFDISQQTSLLSICVKEVPEGISIDACVCDPTLYTIATTEFFETPSFCHFETLMTQTMPSEVLIAGVPDFCKKKVFDIIDKFGINYKTETSKSKVHEIGTLPNTNSCKAIVATIKPNLPEYTIKKFTLSEFMTVDYSAAAALNIFPDGEANRTGLPTSIFALLNICSTPMGSRLLQQMMLQPLLNPAEINKRLDIVEAFIRENEIRNQTHQIMKQLPDVERIMRKFKRGKATLPDCVKLYDVASVVEKFDFFTSPNVAEFKDFLDEITECSENINKAKTLIEATIDFSLIPEHIYRIKPSFDPGLSESAEKVDEIKAAMEKKRQKIAKNCCIEDDKLKIERAANQKSFYLRIPRNMESKIRSDSTVTILETRKDGVHFITPSIKKMADEIITLESEYSVKQREIQKTLLETLTEFSPVFENLSEVFAKIDLFCALAQSAAANQYVRPKLSDVGSPEINLVQARHPILEKHVNFIANDIKMQKGTSSFIIISGPNSAGKSTLLKTVGCCVYMAHIGSFVPCSEATIPIIPSIHARVGASDSLNMSTFTFEMTEMASILESASANSLVIIDELGRSTSCSDGFGLAWAISKKLANGIGAFTLFATHFHELCNLEQEISCVKNFHMKADSEDCLRMMYTFAEGPFGDSFGIDAAERAGFPSEVMKAAREKVEQLEIIDKSNDGKPVARAKVFDPNKPYVNFFRALKGTNFDDMGRASAIKLFNELFKTFDEEKRNNKFEPVA
ncbi:MutS domain III family protein [Trichomonas vaginalis G3]|uniref:MutS domain III family protein n=1 Tax=Trichomonas vaginalis (strain ATCC PRA-98 / G3) TaxID=412133 RepID=A2EP54_TRIV3|nr:mismatch repair protein Msh2 (MutS-like protein) [Trichomonas vaginalis G3]EAY05592.1 MutS domain III family protein [Trichomonas vaginalis G3]KAI5547504.1 mismatch repair protein Msh2 (MutS-like protein) [Trichomonas vaginalis G3]|eukprot:XP_001317815.1 MutS domain III family protein [Trichomonas vaginalis G3]